MKNYKSYILGTALIITFLFIDYFIKHHQKTKIENYKETSIAYTKELLYFEDSSELKFYFYVNGKLFISKQHFQNYPNKSILNKYYKVKYDENNPTNNFIYINKEILPDSTSLVKAGFKLITYYEHNIPTNTYIKKHKWQ